MHRNLKALVITTLLLSISLISAAPSPTIPGLRVQISTEQHLNAKALTLTNTASNAVSIPSDIVEISSSLANNLTICKTDGSNCDRASTCQGAALAPGKSCQIWLQATSPATQALGSVPGTITVNGSTLKVTTNLNLYVVSSSASALDQGSFNRYDGQQWTSLAQFQNSIMKNPLTLYEGDLLFSAMANDGSTSSLLKWNGATNSTFYTARGQDITLSALYTARDRSSGKTLLYTQLSFQPNTNNTIGVFDGSNWTQVGSAIGSNSELFIHNILQWQNKLCVSAGLWLGNDNLGAACLNSATNQWEALGSELNGLLISDMVSYQGVLYAIASHNDNQAHVYTFDAVTAHWQDMTPNGLPANTGVFAQANGNLYLAIDGQSNGHAFFMLNNTPTQSSWQPVGSNDLGAGIHALSSYNGVIYASGTFKGGVAMFNNGTWTTLNMPNAASNDNLAVIVTPSISSITAVSH